MAGTAQGDRARREAGRGASGYRRSRRDRPIRSDPIGGGVARPGGEPDQLGRCRRDRALRWRLRALAEWQSGRDNERIVGGPSGDKTPAGGSAQIARSLLEPYIRRGWRPDLLRG